MVAPPGAMKKCPNPDNGFSTMEYEYAEDPSQAPETNSEGVTPAPPIVDEEELIAAAAAAEAAAAAGQPGGAFQNVGQGLKGKYRDMMMQYWQETINLIEHDDHDFKNHQLPLARIKKVMKTDEDVRMISAEAPILFAKGCDIFITELTMRAWIHAEENKRRTLQKLDIAAALTKLDMFDFLIDVVPREEEKPKKYPLAPAPSGRYYDGYDYQQQGAALLPAGALTGAPSAAPPPGEGALDDNGALPDPTIAAPPPNTMAPIDESHDPALQQDQVERGDTAIKKEVYEEYAEPGYDQEYQ